MRLPHPGHLLHSVLESLLPTQVTQETEVAVTMPVNYFTVRNLRALNTVSTFSPAAWGIQLQSQAISFIVCNPSPRDLMYSKAGDETFP